MTEYFSLIMRGYIGSYSGLPRACWYGISLIFIDALAGGVCFFLSLYFVNSRHIDIVMAGIMFSFYGVGTIVGGIVGGKLADKINPKLISVISLLSQSIAFLLLIKLRSTELLMLNMLLLGISAYGFKTSNNVWILNHCKNNPETKLKTINISRAASNLGLGLSGAVVGMLADNGFQNIFILSSMLLLLGAVFLISCKEKPVMQGFEEEASFNVSELKINKKIITLVLICVFLTGLNISQLSGAYPIYVQKSFPDLGIKAVSFLFILDTILIVLFQAPLVNFLEKQNKIFIAGLGALFMGLGMVLLSFSSVFFEAVIACVIWTTGEMLFVPMAQLVCYEKGAAKKKGQSIGLYQAIYASSIVVGPPLGGIIYQYYGGNMLWYLTGVIGVICFIICNYAKKI